MNHSEKRRYLIQTLLNEAPGYRRISIPSDEQDQKDLLRSLMNVRRPAPIGDDFLRIQDEYLEEVLAEKGVTRLADLRPADGALYIWQGDITTLECDAIVNAANSGLTGCYIPCHNCVDNCIHPHAGIQLRNICGQIMAEQGHEEPTGQAKLTPAYNLPCKYVIHTVGPIVNGRLTQTHRDLLAACYRPCLEAAAAHGCASVAFCCISTGVFGFPQREAAKIAVRTAREYNAGAENEIKVIFNVFKDEDARIYHALLG